MIRVPLVKVEDRRPDSMIFIHGIDNNMLNSGALFSRVNQENLKPEISNKR